MAHAPSPSVTVAFTCVGRRVELVQAFRAAAQRAGCVLRVIGIDSDPTAPALSCTDVAVLAPRVADGGYAAAVLRVVQTHGAGLLIPTTDTDLPIVSAHRDDFTAVGCTALIGEPEVIRTCRDKIRTYEHLRRHGIDTPTTYTPAELAHLPTKPYPLFIKPRAGSASQWVHRLNDDHELAYHLQRVQDPIIQEFVAGDEYTLDVYVGLSGEPRCVVPRQRWQTRTGEVCKGVVVKNLALMQAGQRLVETLGRSLRGLVTLQCIVTPDKRIRFIEVNPRFGGGAPLAIAAGADFPRWLFEELRGAPPTVTFDGFQHGLCMLRYDWSVFVPLAADLKPALNPPLRPPPAFA